MKKVILASATGIAVLATGCATAPATPTTPTTPAGNAIANSAPPARAKASAAPAVPPARMGRLDEASARLRRSLALDPTDKAAQQDLQDVAQLRGRRAR
jgi:hypothetical protein